MCATIDCSCVWQGRLQLLIQPIRLGLHISSIFSIATVQSTFSDESFWKLCKKYHVDKNRSFMMLEPWRNLLLQVSFNAVVQSTFC